MVLFISFAGIFAYSSISRLAFLAIACLYLLISNSGLFERDDRARVSILAGALSGILRLNHGGHSMIR